MFAFMDELLDGECPVTYLNDDAQAEIVTNAFMHFAGERYRLLAFVVMPSHHHWLFLPDEKWSAVAVAEYRKRSGVDKSPREIISHSIQSYTATMCNRVRGEEGTYWQRETYDHWARDENETLRIVRYIENNPVKAGLCVKPEDYLWSSARIRAGLGLEPGQAIPEQ